MGAKGRRRLSGASRGAPVSLREESTEAAGGMDAARWCVACSARALTRIKIKNRLPGLSNFCVHDDYRMKDSAGLAVLLGSTKGEEL